MGAGDPDLPVARAERDHPDPDDSDRGADLVRSDARDGDQLEHHVAGRHRDRGGRDGGRGHRGGGADAQEAGRRGPRAGRRATTSGPS